MGKNKTNTEVINFYVKKELKEKIQEEAHNLGIGVGQYVRMVLMEKLQLDAK